MVEEDRFSSFLANGLLIISASFVIFGVCLIGISVAGLYYEYFCDGYMFATHFCKNSEDGLIMFYILLITGFLAFVLTALGCCGAMREANRLVLSFGIVSVILCLGLIIVTIFTRIIAVEMRDTATNMHSANSRTQDWIIDLLNYSTPLLALLIITLIAGSVFAFLFIIKFRRTPRSKSTSN